MVGSQVISGPEMNRGDLTRCPICFQVPKRHSIGNSDHTAVASSRDPPAQELRETLKCNNGERAQEAPGVIERRAYVSVPVAPPVW
jgi:hypothetical protein